MHEHCQLELFCEKPEASRPPKLGLPFQRSKEVSIERVAKILHVSKMTVRRMLHRQLIRAYPLHESRAQWRIEYDAVVEYCDQLRVHNAISDKRILRPGSRRYRDEDLLPFPLSETISVAEVEKRLDCSQRLVIDLIESGVIVAYQILIDARGCPWRIHGPSFERHMASLHERANRKPTPRRSSNNS